MSRPPMFNRFADTLDVVVAAISYQPGSLTGHALTARGRSALKYYCRLIGLTREETQGPIGTMHAAYDSAASAEFFTKHRYSLIKDAKFNGAPPPDEEPDDDDKEIPEVIETVIETPAPPRDLLGEIPTKTPAPKAVSAADQLQKAMQAVLESMTPSLDVEQVREIVQSELRNHKSPVVTLRIETPESVKELAGVILHAQFKNLVTMMSVGVWPMLVGPAGSGKTTGVELAAKARGRTFRFTGAVDSPHALRGYRTPNGEYVRTPYRESFEHGGDFLWDEIDASDAQAVKAFNADMSNNLANFPDGIVTRHADASFAGAANTWGLGQDRAYVGSGQLDASTLDRFATLPWNYDEDMERAIVPNDDWVAYVQKIRAAVFKLKVRHIVSPRASINGAKLLSAGMDRQDVISFTIRKGMDAATWDKVRMEAGV